MGQFNLADAFGLIKNRVINPMDGLGTEIFHFISTLTPMVNVDLLIKNSAGHTLLTWRSDEFYGPGWHLPGGVLRFKESPHSRLEKVANTELNCSVIVEQEPIKVRSQIATGRDIRGHFISLVYLCKLQTNPSTLKKAITKSPLNGQWKWHKEAPKDLIAVQDSFRGLINNDKISPY